MKLVVGKNNMEQLNLFEAAGMDADTGLPPVTFTKQELINLYKEIVSTISYSQSSYQLGILDVPADIFLSHILNSK